jgi:Xaa-Pro aminopeptidase
MLGIDVHDCSTPARSLPRRPLGEGYVLTVEPGLYFQPEDELVPEELRGIGVRIEDDVLVTGRRLPQPVGRLPRTSADVEAWIASQREAGPRLP